jgi:hypothetical protein
MPAMPASIDVAMIGGAIGGGIALLLIVALIACIIVRGRRRNGSPSPEFVSARDDNVNDVALASVPASLNYAPLSIAQPPQDQYGELVISSV